MLEHPLEPADVESTSGTPCLSVAELSCVPPAPVESASARQPAPGAVESDR